MKNLLLCSVAAVVLFAEPAVAADLPLIAPPFVAPWTWTGCYIGAHIGGGWGQAKWTDPSPAPGQAGTDEGTDDINGFMGGGQAGCNFQTGAWVFGAEADASWADVNADHVNPIFAPDVLHTKVDGLGTITGRVGYSFDRILLYVKGGGAWTHNKYSASAPAIGTYATATETRWGWTVGAGIEYGFTPSWSAKLEYGFLDFGTDRVRLDCPICAAGSFEKDIEQRIHTVKLGLNYRFYP